MNQASDTLFIQSLAKSGYFQKKNLKNDNFLNGIKTKRDKIKNSNIVEKIWFASEVERFQSHLVRNPWQKCFCGVLSLTNTSTKDKTTDIKFSRNSFNISKLVESEVHKVGNILKRLDVYMYQDSDFFFQNRPVLTFRSSLEANHIFSTIFEVFILSCFVFMPFKKLSFLKFFLKIATFFQKKPNFE